MKRHDIKLAREFYLPIICEDKQFEVRKDDRYYTVGDTLDMTTVDNEGEPLPLEDRRWIRAAITYRLQGGRFGIEEGYVVLGIRVIAYGRFDSEGRPTA